MTTYRLCPKFKTAFQILGKPWTGLIIQILLDGPKRFTDILVLLPDMSDRMLSLRLKTLEEQRIVARNVYPERPVRIEYKLTENGEALKYVMDSVHTWADNWIS